ncbi:MAG: NAD(P)H-hydrate dehydratase, partial [Myxococcota bacterium]
GAGRLARRPDQMHKGQAGRVLVVAGRDEYAGAALLATRAAMVAGAGLVTLATHADVTPRVVQVIQEAMASASLSEPWEGARREELNALLDVADTVAIGPGMGRSDTVREVVEVVLARGTSPVVVDADALHAMATPSGIEALSAAAARRAIVITPHPGEMATLCGVTTAEVMDAPLDMAKTFAREHGVVVVLKTATTIVATPDGRLAINATGNSGMASGGMGDALTGILASLLHEVDDAFEAACVAVHAHGAAGDAARDKFGERGVLASRLIDHLGEVFQRMTA